MSAPRKLSKEQILSIPRLIKELETIGAVAEQLGVSWQCVHYHIKDLRKRGIKIKTRAQGSQTTLGRENIRQAIRKTIGVA